ncbi:MAG: hypothetical protein HZB41_04540 [Ignavibacteriae bacterium]|nr:hypothetical protein [Ignavibacteriota bacterium]
MKLLKLLFFPIISLIFFSPLISRDASLDSLITHIKSNFTKSYNIEQSGTGKVAMLEYSASVFRKIAADYSSEEYCYKSKKIGHVPKIGKYYKRIALGIYDFKTNDDVQKALNSFLEGHEVIPQKFFSEGKHSALSAPFLIIIKGNTLFFFYAKCEDIPKKTDWDKITDTFINICKSHYPACEVIRCYCSGPDFLIR